MFDNPAQHWTAMCESISVLVNSQRDPSADRKDARMSTAAMLDTHPSSAKIDRATLARAIDACLACLQTCTACADACLAEPDVIEMVRCIRDDIDCADVCEATSLILSRQTAGEPQLTRAVLEACILACDTCAASCGEHRDHHEHCRICEETCQACGQACRAVLHAF